MTQPNDLLPEGLEDRLPLEAARITAAMRACLDVLDAHGYDRVRPPLLEFEASLAGRMAGAVAGEARAMFRALYRVLTPAAHRHIAAHCEGADGLLPAETAATALRMAGLAPPG